MLDQASLAMTTQTEFDAPNQAWATPIFSSFQRHRLRVDRSKYGIGEKSRTPTLVIDTRLQFPLLPSQHHVLYDPL